MVPSEPVITPHAQKWIDGELSAEAYFEIVHQVKFINGQRDFLRILQARDMEKRMAHIREPHVRPLADQPNRIPTRKVSAGVLAGALTTIGVAIAESLGVVLESGVEGAIVVVLTFAASYIIKERA